MTDIEENQFQEVEEMLDKMLKQEFIAPDEVDEYSKVFKQIFLTIDNKEEFFPFLSRFIEQAENNDEYVEERLDSLRTEIDSFFDKIGANFSIHHIAGYKDPNDAEKSNDSSDNIDESFSFIKTNNLNDNLFGPEIPEKHRPLVQKVLENISTLAQQKQDQRKQIIIQWRYLAMANQIQKLKQQSPAINTIYKFLNKKYNLFYKLRSWSRYNNNKAKLINSQDVITRYEKELEDLKRQLENELNRKPKEVVKKTIDPAQIEKIKKLQDLLDKSGKDKRDLRDQLTAKQREELERNKQDMANQNKMNDLQAMMANLQRNKKRLENANEEKNRLLDDKDQMLAGSKKRLQELLDQFKDLEGKYKSKNLNHFQKFRFFMRVMNIFMLRMKAFGFMKIFKRKEKAKIALQNVTDRIKARLLIQTRNHNCGKDIRKSFLKWMIKANPDLMRSLLSKICLTSKINPTVSIWRLKKLVEKPFVAKLPEAVKAVRRLKAFFQLANLVDNKDKRNMKGFVDLINPHRFSIKGNKLKKVFDKAEDNNKKKLKDVLKRLRHNKNVQRNILQKMIDNYLVQQRVAMWILKLKRRQGLDFDDMMKVNRLCQRLRDNKFISAKNFFKKFQNQNKIEGLISKLVGKQNMKQQKAINAMRKVNFETKMKMASETNTKYNLIEALVRAQNLKKRQALWKCLLNQLNAQKNEDGKNSQLKNAFNKSFGKQRDTMKEILNRLRRHKNNELEKQNKKERLVKELVRQNLNKRNGAYSNIMNEISKAKQQEGNTNDKMKSIFSDLKKAQNGKLRQILNRLQRNQQDLNSQDNVKEKLVKKMVSFSKSNLLRDALQRLRDFRNQQEQGDRDTKIQEYAIKMLIQRQQSKKQKALQSLINNKQELEGDESIKHKIKELMCKRLGANGKENLAKVFYKLVNHKNNEEKQEQEDDFKKRYAVRTVKLLAQSQQRQALESIKSQTNQERNDNKSKALLRLVTAQNAKQNNAVQNLKTELKKSSDQDAYEQNRKNKLLTALRGSMREKLLAMIGKLQINSLQSQLEEEREKNKKRMLLQGLVNSMAQKRNIAMYKVLMQNLAQQLQEFKNRQQQQNFLNMLKKIDNKKKQAFKNLIENAKKEKDKQEQHSNAQKKALKRLVQCQNRKAQIALDNLLRNAMQKKYDEELQRIKNKFKQMQEERKRKGILYLLIAAQEEKMKRSLFCLRKWCKERHNDQILKNNKLGKILNKTINHYNKALLDCIQKLYNNKEEALREQQEKDEKKRRQYEILGLDPGLIDQNKEVAAKIKSMLTDAGSSNEPIQKHMADLLEYMKNNNGNGLYDDIIHKIENKDISDPADLLDYVNKNNKDGKYDELKKWVNNPQLEMENLKHFMQLNNGDGRYNPILDEMKKNKDFNKIDLLEYIDNNNLDGKLNPLKNKIQDHTRLQDILDFLRRHNKDGKYDKILEWASKKNNAKLSDLQNYIKRHNQDGKLDDVLQKINEPELGAKQIAKLIKFMKNNNGDGRYTEPLNYLFSKSIPKLSDLNQFFNQKSANEFLTLKDIFNHSRKTPGEQFIEDLKNSHQKDDFEPIIKKYENKNPKITEIFNELISTKNPLNDAALEIMEKSNVLADYDKFMLRHNNDNQYDEIRKNLKRKNFAQITDLMNAIKKCGDQNKIKPLLKKLNQSNILDSLKDFLQRKNEDGQYQTLIDYIDKQQSPDLYDAYQYVIKNKKNLDYKPIIDEINGKEQDFPSPIQGYINKLKNSDDITFQKLAQRINSMSTPTIPKVLNLIRKNNKYNKFDETFEWIDQTKPCQQVESLKGYLRYNKNMANMKPLNEILKSEKPKLTDLFNFIAKNNEDGKLEILKEILNEDYKYDLLEEAVKFMKRNNQDGDYNELLNYVKESKDPKLTDLIDMIQKDGTGKYDDLLDVIEEKDRKKKFEELMKYIKDHNKDGKYNYLIQHLDQYKHPNTGDVIEYVTRNNHDKKYDDIIRFLLGKRFSSNDLLEKLKENNKDGKYDDIIKFIEKNPNQPIELVMQKIKALNDDGKYDDLLDFLKNPSKDMPLDQNEEDDFFKMLSKAKKKGQYGDLFDYMKQNDMYDPDDILDYLKRNNKDGKFDDLIRQLEGYLNKQKQDNIKQTPKGFSIIYPQLQKMRQALQALLDHNYKTKNKQEQDDLKKKQILQRLLLNHQNLKRDAVKALKDHQNKKINEEKKLQYQQKKFLKNLIRAQKMKSKQAINSMYKNANDRGGQQKDQNNKLSNLFNKAATRYDRKKMKILDELRNHNYTMQKIMQQLTGKLVKGNIAKQKAALQELINNCRKKRDLEAKQKRMLDQLMKAQMAKEKQCINSMKDNNRNKKFNEKMNDYLKKNLLRQLKVAQENKAKLALEEFKTNKQNLLGDDEKLKNKQQRLLKKLVKSQQAKKLQCVNEFKANKRLMKLRDQIKNRLFSNNKKNTKNLMKHILDQLRDNNNKNLQKERENMSKLNHVFQKLPEKYLRAPFDAIVLNYPVQLFRDQKRKRAMDFVNRLCRDQQRGSYKKLQDSLSLQQQQQRKKNKLVARLVNALRQKQDRVFDEMHKFAQNRTKELQRALKKIKIQVQREQMDYLQKLKQHYLQQRRNKFTSKLNNMLFCLKKNHKANIKQAFHHWNGTEKKKKIKVGTEILEALIRRRENNSYTTIKQYYLYLKFENIIKGLLKLMKLVDKKETQYKREFLELITIRNPWFQKVIKIWSTQCKPNDQIAFWRMRFGGNLKQEGVSADQVLKIKKLEYIAQKRIQHNISNTFWKIKVYSENQEGKEKLTLKSMFMKYQ